MGRSTAELQRDCLSSDDRGSGGRLSERGSFAGSARDRLAPS
ncbi:hypothetical protein ACFPRL_35795 [Pseudoclavibacter helvolus]